MRRKQGQLGPRTRLSLVVNTTPVDSFLAAVSEQPTAPPSVVGNAVAEVAEDLESHELPVGSDWPSRPDGVSDEVLLNEWLRLHTPKASVSVKRRRADGSYKRTSVNHSGSILPRAIALNDGAYARQDVYVTSLKERMDRINNSSKSRYRVGAAKGKVSNVQSLVNPKAVEYALSCHKHQVRIWTKVVGGIVRQSLEDHKGYDFEDRISARRMAWHEKDRDLLVDDLPWDASNDASVVSTPSSFVGPLQPTVTQHAVEDCNVYYPLTDDARSLMAKIEAREYNARRRQLELVFRELDKPVTKPKTAVQATVFAPVDKWEKELRAYYWNRKNVPNFKAKANSYTTRHMKQMLQDWNDVKGQNHRAVYERSQQYRYMLKQVKNGIKPVHITPDSMSLGKWWALVNAGHDLPGCSADPNTYFPPISDEAKKSETRARWHYYLARKRELEVTFYDLVRTHEAVVKAVTPTDKALVMLYDRLIVEGRKAKAAILEDVYKARFELFGVEYKTTESGLILPATTGVSLPVL